MKLSLGINKKFGVCPDCQNELYFKLGKLTSKPLPRRMLQERTEQAPDAETTASELRPQV